MTTDAPVVVTPKVALKMGERGFDFDFDSAWRFAQGLIAGGMVPKGITNPGAVVGLIEAGRELGLPAMYALANLTFTNGRLGIMGDAAKALIRRAGVLEPGTDFTETYSGKEGTAEWACTVSAHRKGQPAPFSRTFSIADGIKAALVKIDGTKIKSRKGQDWIDYGPWSTYTARMLMYRAAGFLCRDYFSDVLGGCVVAEELADYPPPIERDVSAAAALPETAADPLFAKAERIVEIDPDTGEVIPDHVGRDAQGELL